MLSLKQGVSECVFAGAGLFFRDGRDGCFDELLDFMVVLFHGVDDVFDGDGVVFPDVVVRHGGDAGVAELCFSGEDALGDEGHADDVGVPASEEL